MHKEIVQAQVKVGEGKYTIVECEVTKVDNGDSITFNAVQANRYNQGLTLEAQRKLRDSYLTSKGLKSSTAKGKEVTRGENVNIDIE